MPSKEDLLNDINYVVSMSSRQDMSLPANAKKVKALLEQKKVLKTPVGTQYLQRLGQISDRKNPSTCFICKNGRAVDGVLCNACMNKYSHGKSFYSDVEDDEDDYEDDEYEYETTSRNTPAIVKKLINGIRAVSILWIVIASLQLFCGVILCLCILVNPDLSAYAVSAIEYFIFGSINLVINIVALTNASKLKTNYKNITERYSFKKIVGVYIWNSIVIVSCILNLNCASFIFACLLITSIILDIILIRIYVSNNKSKFNKL